MQTEYGLLFVNREIEFEDFYNGTTFPGYFCNPDAIANVGIFYRGITEYVELPCEDIAIKKAICSDEQLEQLRYCVKFALENDENMSLSCQEALESLKEKIDEIVPEQQQSSSPKMSM